ncbi:MAG: VWA domain-containing protein [Planctomycetes bacterium]|nr:VWA domain-containing protein [Planctomycetota bacterium]
MRRARRGWIVVGALVLGCTVLAGVAPSAEGAGAAKAAGGAKPAAPPEPAPGMSAGDLRAKAIDTLVTHYLEMYGEHLQRPDWMARAMAVIGLAEIDDPRITEKLVQVLDGDKLPLVRVYAWEALHARLTSLTNDQQEHWLKTGKTLLRQNHLRGDLRVGLVRAMAHEGPTDENRQLFGGLFQHTNAMDASDIRTLDAMRDALARWRDPALIKALIASMADLDCVFRAEYVLQGLPWAPKEKAASFFSEGSTALCEKTQELWARALVEAGPKALEKQGAPRHKGPSPVILAPEKITDPGDKKWRQDLELVRFKLDHLDVAMLVDSTGSMKPVIRWIQRDVTKLMQAFYLISNEPRLGIVFYRDQGDLYVTKIYPFTGQAEALSQAIQNVTADGGGDEPEAVREAMVAALAQQKWSGGEYARRIVVLVGDAPPHPETMDDVRRLVTTAAGQDFRFFCLKVRDKYTAGDLEEFDQIARWGNGQSFWTEFEDEAIGEFSTRSRSAREMINAVDAEDRPEALTGVADPSAADPYRQLVRNIIRTAVPEAYERKTKPFVDTLLEYLETPVPEKRKQVYSGGKLSPPKPPGRGKGKGRGRGGGGGGGPQG